MASDWPSTTSRKHEELTRVANMLFSKGLAASLWDAQMKARDIVGLSAEEHQRKTGQDQKIGADVNKILQGAGIKKEEIIQAAQKEAEENQKVMDAALKQFSEEKVFTDALAMDQTVEEAVQEPIEVQTHHAPTPLPAQKHEEDELYKDFEG